MKRIWVEKMSNQEWVILGENGHFISKNNTYNFYTNVDGIYKSYREAMQTVKKFYKVKVLHKYSYMITLQIIE